MSGPSAASARFSTLRNFADLKFSVEWGDRSDWRGGANAGVIDEDNTQCNVSLVTAYNDSQEGDNSDT